MSRYIISRIKPSVNLLNSSTSLPSFSRIRLQSIGIRHASGHGPVYTPPTGYLFNEKPPRKGKKRRREDWEPYMWLYFAVVLYSIFGYISKEKHSMEIWALRQARKRMEEDGISLDYKVD